MTSWERLMEIVLWELHEILSFSKKKNGLPFCDKKNSAFFFFGQGSH